MINEKVTQDLKDKLDNILELHNWQLERGFNTIRQQMIQELLLDVQSEVVHTLANNNESSYRQIC